LPWSTSVTAVFVVIWCLSLLSAPNFSAFWQESITWRGGTPLVLCFLALISVLWSDAGFAVALEASRPLLKLFAVPILLTQFRESKRGLQVLGAYLISCSLLLTAAILSWLFPAIASPLHFKAPGLPEKDYIAQGGEFILCASGLAYLLVLNGLRTIQRTFVAALAALFLFAAIYVQTSRTALITTLVLATALGSKFFGLRRGILTGLCVSVMVLSVSFLISDYVNQRVDQVFVDIFQYTQTDVPSSVGVRMEYWEKSIKIIRSAPLFGHGLGSTTRVFADAAIGRYGLNSLITDDPHNQVLAVAIPLGLVGCCALIAMWLAHFLIFARSHGVAWLGTLVVLQNISSSMFNSHINNFTQGWTYVFGVGVLGGMALRQLSIKGSPSDKNS
jgi:O-antigen ligase